MKLKTFMTVFIPVLLNGCGYDPPLMNFFVGTYPTCPPFHSYASHEYSSICERPYCFVRNGRGYMTRSRYPVQTYGDASRAVYGYGNGVALYCHRVGCQ